MEKDIKDFFRCVISNKNFVKQYSIGTSIKILFSDFSAYDEMLLDNFCETIEDVKKRNIIRIFSSMLSYKDRDFSKITLHTFIDSEDLDKTISETLDKISSSEFELISNKYQKFITLLDTLLEECSKEDF